MASMLPDADGVKINPIDGQAWYVGQGCQNVPVELIEACAAGSIRRLDLSFNELKCIAGLERLAVLEELILDNNELTDALQLPALDRLHTLTLNKNQLNDLEPLLEQVVERLPALRYLSLLGNQACPNELSTHTEDDYLRYRLYVLHRLPSLKFLDSTPVKEDEWKEAQKKGSYLKVIRPAQDSTESPEQELPSSSYTPLPSDVREEPNHKATFGKCRYVYYGRHSEGNRFIRNNDL